MWRVGLTHPQAPAVVRRKRSGRTPSQRQVDGTENEDDDERVNLSTLVQFDVEHQCHVQYIADSGKTMYSRRRAPDTVPSRRCTAWKRGVTVHN